MPLSKVLVAALPICLLLAGSAVAFIRRRTVYPFLQLLGAACLLVVLFTHICEALHWFPGMRWGLEHSAGHYVDLGSAATGITLFCVGYFLHALSSN